jgi:hypothetical protein
VGTVEGSCDGTSVGALLGASEGDCEGASLGAEDGEVVGERLVGLKEGIRLGKPVGTLLGV